MTNSDATPNAGRHDPTSPVVRLLDTAGYVGAATPADVADRLQADTFFWLDLQDLSDQRLPEFGGSLKLSPDIIETLAHGTERSSFAPRAGSLIVMLPWVTGADQLASENARYLRLALTDKFLLTVHSADCEPLRRASTTSIPESDEDAGVDAPRLLFRILDSLVESFKPQLLAIDDRLGEIQLELLGGGSPEVHDELIKMLGVLTDGIQEFGWYAHDLEDVADAFEELPGMRPGSQEHFQQHRRRIARMTGNAREIRGEAKDALSQYSASIAGRQAGVLNRLTIVATVFLPLSFLTGYFGMNFNVLVSHLQTTLWSFILLALLLPLASASLSLLLIHRLQRRLGINRSGPP